MQRALRGLEHQNRPLSEAELLYPDCCRHPRLSKMKEDFGVNDPERVVVAVRNPIDRYKSIKRFILRDRNRTFSKETDLINTLVIHLLHRGYDYLVDVDTETELIRYETLESDFERIFNRTIGGISNSTNPSLDVRELSHRELDLIKKLNPYEWDLYDCDNQI